MKHGYIILLALAFMACSNKEGGTEKTPDGLPDDSLVTATPPDTGIAPAEDAALAPNAEAAEPEPEAKESAGAASTGAAKQYYTGSYDKKKSYIVISKRDLRLYVYADVDGAPRLLADYPCCLSRNKGQKERRGDNKTPESPAGKPFKIQQIQDASSWRHDFHDGRGNILAYGHWFLRLLTPGHSGIGIHGSTNNESSVPGRASEGCIRLLDRDIIHLKDTYAWVGMPVTIQAEGAGHLPFMDGAKRDEAKPINYGGKKVAAGEPEIADPGAKYHVR